MVKSQAGEQLKRRCFYWVTNLFYTKLNQNPLCFQYFDTMCKGHGDDTHIVLVMTLISRALGLLKYFAFFV